MRVKPLPLFYSQDSKDMDNAKKLSVLNRILTGTVCLSMNNTVYTLSPPNKQQIALGEMVYQETLNDCKYNDLMTRDQAAALLHKRRIWTTENDSQYEQLSKSLEDLKVELYRSLYNDRKKDQLRKRIKQVNRGLHKSLEKKYSLDHMTLENHAETTRDEFITAICIKDPHGNPVYSYDNWNKEGNYVLQRFLNHLMKNIITVEEYREIARTDPFRSMWMIGQATVFDVPACLLTMEQKSLIMYSRMYDNVYEHMERPSDEVIEDDDMLDGWFIQERREAEKERKKKEVDKLLDKKGAGKHGAGGELFVVAETQTEAQKIRELNDLNTAMKMKQRDQALREKGRLEEHQLPDVQLELRNEAMRQIADRGKK